MKSKKSKRTGRIPLPKGEKRKSLRIFPREREIDNCGGEAPAKQIALRAIENHKP